MYIYIYIYDKIVQNQTIAQANRGHRADLSALPGGTTHPHPKGPTENLRERNNHSRPWGSPAISYGPQLSTINYGACPAHLSPLILSHTKGGRRISQPGDSYYVNSCYVKQGMKFAVTPVVLTPFAPSRAFFTAHPTVLPIRRPPS